MSDEFFSQPYYDHWLKLDMPELQKWFQGEIDYLRKNIKSDSIVLDIGCGFGRHIKILADRVREVVGIDNNKEMVRRAKESLKDYPNVKIFLQDAGNLNLQDNFFDYVICMNNTFGNFGDDKIKILKEMKRVCKGNGRVIISVYSENAMDVRLDSYKRIGFPIIKTRGGVVFLKSGGGILRTEQFSKDKLKNIFRKVGLVVDIKELSDIGYLCEVNI